MKLTLDALIAKAELTDEEIGKVLDIDRSTVCNKRAGRRAWTLSEGTKLAALISARIGRRVTVESIEFPEYVGTVAR